MIQSMPNDSITSFPGFAGWLSDHCELSDDPFVRDSWKMISYCFELDRKIPSEYRWRYVDLESFQNQVSGNNEPVHLNRLYWTDQARIIEAYSLTIFWRGMEMLKPAIRSLNTKELITSAVLARSLLELSSVFLVHANNIQKTFSDLQFPDDAVVISSEFEESILKMMWGTRIGEPAPHLKQTNVMTFMTKLAKHPNGKEILPTYEFLCDIAHPCHMGNTRFWSHVESVDKSGAELRVISRNTSGPPTHDILNRILWTLGWSAAVLRNSFEITSSGVEVLAHKIGLTVRGSDPEA